MKRKSISLWLALMMVISLAAGMSMPSFAAEQDIVVLYTNDVHCGVEENIGYAGLSLYKKQMQQQTPYVALVDAGDAIQGAPVGTLSEGGDIIDIMNQVGYDFAIPGNHEYDYGMPRFLELSKKLNCGYYSSNFMDLKTGAPVFLPYKMMAFGNRKVAFVGASTPESFTKSTPSYFQDENGNYIYGFCEDESGGKFYSQIQSSVDAARAEGADYVILVGHLGQNGVTDRWRSDQVIKNTTGIDACIDGHSHETIPSVTVPNKEGKQVIISQTGSKLKSIGKLTIKPDGAITTELISEVPATKAESAYTVKKGDSLKRIAKKELGTSDRWRELYQRNKGQIVNPDALAVGMTLAMPGTGMVTEQGKAVDYETDQYVKRILAQFEESLKTVLGYTEYDLTANNPETGKRAVRNAETNLGDLSADAYRYVLGADIGLSNGGGIRDSIKAGTITYRDTLKVFPFGNMGCVVEATGQQVKDALEMSAKNYPEESGGFLQVSGITYTIDSSVSSSVQLDDKRNFVKVHGAYRVTDIKINGEPIDLGKTYTVASLNYMLKSGGDGMTMFMGNQILKDDIMADVDIISRYINNNLGGSVGGEYANPGGQGRITIK